MRVTVQRAAALPNAASLVVRAAALGPLLRRCGDSLGVAARIGMTLRLCDDEELTALNQRLCGVDSPTDVLAFPAEVAGYLGDVAISVPRALAQAADGVAELRLLAVHGLLHCLGHDHETAAGARRMTAATQRLLPGQRIAALRPPDAR